MQSEIRYIHAVSFCQLDWVAQISKVCFKFDLFEIKHEPSDLLI